MFASTAELEAGGRLAIAALVATAVGLEREWSGQTTGPNARFAGMRTFLLLGLTGGVAGLLLEWSHAIAGAALIACTLAFTIAAYVMATRRPTTDIGGTTEAAAMTVVALGVLAGLGYLVLAAGAGSIVVLALSEKTRLHWFVGRVGERELRATLQFAVLSLVVLPILPAGPFGGPLDIQPRSIWIIALMFSGLSFAAYLLRRALGSRSGYIVTGLAGGLVSSTAVTIEFSRRSRSESGNGAALAFGVLGACTVLIPRVIMLSSLLSPDIAIRLSQLLWLPALIGFAITLVGWRLRGTSDGVAEPELRNPLRLGAAVQLALAFQVAVSLIAFVHTRWGTTGVYATASLLGLTDVDALTMSMSRLDGGLTADIAASAIAVGIAVNTGMKLFVSLTLGANSFRRIAVPGLIALGLATVAAIVI